MLNSLTDFDKTGNLLDTPIAYFEMKLVNCWNSSLFKSCSINVSSSFNSSRKIFNPSVSNVIFLDNMYVILSDSNSATVIFKFMEHNKLVNILIFVFYKSTSWSCYVLKSLLVSLFWTDLNKCLGIYIFFKIELISLSSLYLIRFRMFVILFSISSRFWVLPVVGLVDVESLLFFGFASL